MTITKWLPFTQIPTTTRFKVFCFPHSGSGASCYKNWIGKDQGTVQYLPIQLPGRESRFIEKPYTEMNQLVRDFCEIFDPYIDEKTLFFGHSLGGYVAFECAKYFRQRHPHLVVSASNPPKKKRTQSIRYLPDNEFMSELASYGGMPKEIKSNKELIKLLLPVLRADITLFETYQPDPSSKIGGSLAVIGGKEDPIVPQDSLSGWETYTGGIFKKYIVDGGHFFHRERPEEIKKLVEHFTAELH